MQLMTLYCLLMLCLYCADAEVASPGICITSAKVTKKRFVFDRNGTWVLQEYQVPMEQEGCCKGFHPIRHSPLACGAICDPPCKNASCTGPNICTCHPGHKLVSNSSSTCLHICDACAHGRCMADAAECTCDDGYQQDEVHSHICNPVCHPPCEHGTCAGPQHCQCDAGYINFNVSLWNDDREQEMHHLSNENQNLCVPHCSEGCLSGKCTAPGVCTCNKGYLYKNSTNNVCVPVCSQTCENGYCSKPEYCSCEDGFQPNPRNLFQCVPKNYPYPEMYSKNYCKVEMQKSIKFKKELLTQEEFESDCFVLKNKIKFKSNTFCQALKPLSDPKCLNTRKQIPIPSSDDQCVLVFRCFMTKSVDGSKEVHCGLEKETESFHQNEWNGFKIEMNSTEWRDVTLVVNSFQAIDTVHNGEDNTTHEWCLHPSNNWAVCKNMHFLVEISNCHRQLVSSSTETIDASVLLMINAVLIVGCVLLVGVGAGGFLWARHRRLNDPLNYRENVRGYNNQCFEHEPTDLVSSSDTSSDAQL